MTDAERQLLLFVAAALGNPWNDVVSGVSWNGEQTPKQRLSNLIAAVQKEQHPRYQLKGGEYVSDGILYGWTGQKCASCKGHGELADDTRCPSCSGVGEEHGIMPVQPPNLPEDTE